MIPMITCWYIYHLRVVQQVNSILKENRITLEELGNFVTISYSDQS